jgi:hypothetical protein
MNRPQIERIRTKAQQKNVAHRDKRLKRRGVKKRDRMQFLAGGLVVK